MSAEERMLELSGSQMLHTYSATHYSLLTLVDVVTKAAVGLQVWGSVGEISGHKIITGTEASVNDQQRSKQREKYAVREGEHYYEVSSRITPVDRPASKMMAVIKMRLVGMAPRTHAAKLDEIADEMFRKLGLALQVAADEFKEEEKAKTKQEQMQERQPKGADYGGMWGAW